MKNIIMSLKYKVGLLTVLTALMVSSCSKSFRTQIPYDGVPAGTAVTDEVSMYTAVLGMYSSLRATDFYGRTFAIKGDLMSDDCFLSSSNSGRYLGFNNYDMDKTNSYPSAVWLNSYAAIKNANFILNSGVAPATDNITQMFSEAYAVRGMVLFDLVRNFAMPYASGATGAGVPIVLTIDKDAKPARDNIGKVYTQVLADLTKAFATAKFDQSAAMKFAATGQSRTMNSSYLTKYAIEGLLARVYQHMGDWANAKAAALDIVQNGGYSLVNSTGVVGYWAGTNPRADKVETMFEVTNDGNNNQSDGTLANIYVPKTVGGSYGDILATKTLYDSYSATDTRKGLFNPATRAGQLGTAYYVTKYPIDVVNYDDIKIVRYAEVLLILAEAYHNTGDDVNALKYLNLVAQKRDPAFAGYASSGAQLLEDILNEREKEMAFEGYRFWDLYRLQRTFVKPQAQDAANAIIKSVTVTPGTTRNFIFPIPNDEVLVNPGIGQNPLY
ncbi:MAG TPA: RagB/SusD family nutrient uptake outer membrane protein [Puia sp.]|nr:RagB/SusD family nutrient uptake outer membrane protein [Puia sp.]